MGYPNGVRYGHASGHLREPVIDALDAAFAHRRPAWWGAWESSEAARRAVGMLWHCTDIVPGDTRRTAAVLLDLGDEWQVGNFAQLSRALLADLRRAG